MTMGPAPMIRIERMSVRLGIVRLAVRAQKKAASNARPSSAPRRAFRAAALPLAQNRRRGKGERFSLPEGEGWRDAAASSRGGVIWFTPPARAAGDRRPLK